MKSEPLSGISAGHCHLQEEKRVSAAVEAIPGRKEMLAALTEKNASVANLAFDLLVQPLEEKVGAGAGECGGNCCHSGAGVPCCLRV